jgi:Surp module/CID domain
LPMQQQQHMILQQQHHLQQNMQYQQQPQQQQQQHMYPVAPPLDPQYSHAVERMAALVVKNGEIFEGHVKQKETNNPQFAFLWPGGRSHDYYQWVLHCTRTGTLQAPQQQQQQPVQLQYPVPQHQQSPHLLPQQQQQQQQEAEADLSPEDQATFYKKMSSLNGSREFISGMRDWLLTLLPATGTAVAVRLRKFAQAVQTTHAPEAAFPAVLHIIYVLNDVFFAPKCPASFKEQCFAQLPAILRVGSTLAPAQGDADRLARVVSIWQSKGVYNDVTALTTAVSSKTAPLAPPPTPLLRAASVGGAVPQQQQQQQPLPPPPVLHLPQQLQQHAGWPPQPPQHLMQQQQQQFNHMQQQQQPPPRPTVIVVPQQQQHPGMPQQQQQQYAPYPGAPLQHHMMQQQHVQLPPHLQPQHQQQHHVQYAPPPPQMLHVQQQQQQQHLFGGLHAALTAAPVAAAASVAMAPHPSPSPPATALQTAYPVAAGAVPHAMDLDK